MKNNQICLYLFQFVHDCEILFFEWDYWKTSGITDRTMRRGKWPSSLRVQIRINSWWIESSETVDKIQQKSRENYCFFLSSFVKAFLGWLIVTLSLHVGQGKEPWYMNGGVKNLESILLVIVLSAQSAFFGGIVNLVIRDNLKKHPAFKCDPVFKNTY